MKKWLFWLLLLSMPTSAEIITDGSLGTKLRLSGGEYAITQDLGTVQGANLFHSFEQFSLARDESATFFGNATIENIFNRVTGGEVSTIDGLIRSDIPNANIYLMNPAGVVFNNKASLDIQGSFYATTADVIRFSDENDFYADLQQNSVLSAAKPSAFGFLDAKSGEIDVLGAKLSLPANQTLNFTSHHFTMQSGTLETANGNIHLTSVASAGEVSLQTHSAPTTTLGYMQLSDNTSITTEAKTTDVESKRGEITIKAGLFELTDSSLASSAKTYSTGGNITIQAQDFIAKNASITSLNRHNTTGGNIDITAENQILLAASEKETATNKTLISTSNLDTAITPTEIVHAGDSGNINLSARDIQILDGSTIQSTAFGSGRGGKINLSASNDIVMRSATDSPSKISSSSGQTTLSDQSVGDGGDILITAKNLTMNNGANITANANALGKGGNMNIHLNEKLTLEQESTSGIGNFMSAATTSKHQDAGAGGRIVIQANELFFTNGSFLTTNTAGSGNAGDINVNIARNAIIKGASARTDSGILSAASSSSRGGNAGNIALTVGNQLYLDELAIIDASNFNTGLGGNVNIVAGDIVMRNQAYIGAASASSGNTGDIQIQITQDNLEMYDTSYITTEATFADGGNIYLSMPNYVYIGGNSEITTSIKSGVGGGGNIDLKAEFTVLDNGKILAQAYGGPGGNIDIVTTSIYNLTEQPIEQVISASSQLGVDGIVTVRSPDSDTDEGVLVLSGNFLQAEKLLRNLCDRQRNKGNSFVITGQESYANLLDDWLPSNTTQLVLQRCE